MSVEKPTADNRSDRFTWAEGDLVRDNAPPNPDVLARIQAKLERSIPVEGERRAALELLAYAIENADDERSDAWTLRETGHGLALTTGRIQACRITRGKAELSVMGLIGDDVRTLLGAEAGANEAWRAVPGGICLTFHVEKAAIALELLKDPFDKFVDEAMARVRRKVSLDDHVPEAIAYISSAVGRELPQPSPAAEKADEDDDDADDDEGETPASREPRIRGRAPIFEHGQRSIASLMSDVELETMALPDLQRPFVWEDTKVRDLLDSLFLGFPVGTLVLWHTSDAKDARGLGQASGALKTNTLVIDGQQRLTSLHAVMRRKEVLDKDGAKRRITIAFRPRDGRFEVADAAIKNDPEFLPDVSELWTNARTKSQIRRDLLKSLQDKGRIIDDNYENAVDQNLDRAQAISEYRFPVVEIRKTASSEEAREEDVAEIFVRINNQGTRLNQADFVLTLLSVFHGPLRDRIETRAAEMSQDAVVPIDTQQLLRATCAVGFGRARMSAVYRFLRGVDPSSGDTNVAEREVRLKKLEAAADECIHKNTWRDYMLRVAHAGLVSRALVASNNAIINAYAFYVLGLQHKVPKPRLEALISRWLFGTQLTSRYSGSSESVFEQDLARVRSVGDGDADAFVNALDGALAEQITGDYWSLTVTGALQSQRGRAPAALAFRAAQVVLGARALFSDQLLQNLFNPPAKGKRSPSEAHHLFPRGWLKANGVTERRRINQVANFADTGWWENLEISDEGPAVYVPRFREQLQLDDDRWGRACAEHALPPGWEKLDYETFLRERRARMADVIRAAYRKLGGEPDAPPIAPPWFLPGAELVWSRIVETERALRSLVRDVYSKRFGAAAASKIEQTVPERERESLTRALRARPAGADPLSVVDYLYLGQLPPLLFSNEVWSDVRQRLGDDRELKQKLENAIRNIAPIRNEIAHVREVGPDRLQKANVACNDVLALLQRATPAPQPQGGQR